MTMTEIYNNTEKWVKEMEEEADNSYLEGYGPELNEAWDELEEEE